MGWILHYWQEQTETYSHIQIFMDWKNGCGIFKKLEVGVHILVEVTGRVWAH